MQRRFTFIIVFTASSRSNYWRCSIKKGVFKTFIKFTEKHLCWILFLNKVAGLRPPTLLKKRLQYRYFTVNFVKFLRSSFLQALPGDCFFLFILSRTSLGRQLSQITLNTFNRGVYFNVTFLFSILVGTLQICRSSRSQMFLKIGVLKNFSNFCQSLFFNKVAGPRPATLLKKRPRHRCFTVNFAKFVRTSFLQNICFWRERRELLLHQACNFIKKETLAQLF